MADNQLYAMAFPADVLETEDPSASRQQSRLGVLEDSTPAVETVAPEPGSRSLRGRFVGNYSDVMAGEIQELLQASGDIDAVPYYPVNGSEPWQGYYAPAEQRQGDRSAPPVPNAHTVAGVLTPKGTQESHVRSVRIRPDTVNTTFSDTADRTVFLPANATDPRWMDETRGRVEDATAVATHDAEYGTQFTAYNASEPAFRGNETYALVYDVSYDVEWQTDPRVWDDYDRARSITANNVTVAPTWARVFTSQHDYQGNRTIDTGRLRLSPAPAQNAFSASEWNATSEQYEVVSLGASSWELTDWDIRRIGIERVESRTRWQNASDTTQTHELVAEARRGANTTHFYEVPNNASATPDGLTTLLTPIAANSTVALGEQAGLVRRQDVPDGS